MRALKSLRDVTIQVGGQRLVATTPPTGKAVEILAALQDRSLRTKLARSRSEPQAQPDSCHFGGGSMLMAGSALIFRGLVSGIHALTAVLSLDPPMS